jgi:hypothetical protein
VGRAKHVRSARVLQTSIWFRYREGITFTPTGEKFEATGLKM